MKSVLCYLNMEYEICDELVFFKWNCSYEIKLECFKIDGEIEKKCEIVCGCICEKEYICRRFCYFFDNCNCC